MIGIIYKIESPSGRLYIGQTTNYIRRIRVYKNTLAKDQPKLRRSFIKYGFENHKFEILEECTIDILNEREVYYINFYDCVNKGLNCCYDPLAPMKGRKHSKRTKEKLSKCNKGLTRNFSAEHKLNMSLSIKKTFDNGRIPPNSGKKLSQKTRDKISAAKIGIKLSEEHKAKINPLGRKHSQQTLEKLVKNSGRRKLKLEDLNQIKDLLSEGNFTQAEIGVKFGISHCTISDISRGKRGYLSINNS